MQAFFVVHYCMFSGVPEGCVHFLSHNKWNCVGLFAVSVISRNARVVDGETISLESPRFGGNGGGGGSIEPFGFMCLFF